MNLKIANCALFVVAAFSIGPASAATGRANLSTMKSNVERACKSDIDKYCKGITPGGGRIADCLNSREPQLSSGCKSIWGDAKEDIQKRFDQANVEFHQSCGTDLQKYCPKVAPGGGRLLSCLGDHKDNLSASCQEFQAKLEQRLSEFFS